PQAMTAMISLAARWLDGSAKARMPLRRKARRRGWWFSVDIDQPTTVLPRQPRQLPGDLLPREHDHRSRAVGIGATHQPCRVRPPCGHADNPCREKVRPPPPALPLGAAALVFLREPVDVLDRLSNPFQAPNQPGVLARPALRPGFADCLPGVPQSD